MGVSLWICCLFSEHLFLWTPSEGCFWLLQNYDCYAEIKSSIGLKQVDRYSLFLLTHLFPMHHLFTPWKRQKTLRFSDVFREVEKECLGNKWVKVINWNTLTTSYRGSCSIVDVVQNRSSKKFCNIHRKTLRWNVFIVKLQTFKSATLLKGDSQTWIWKEKNGLYIALKIHIAFIFWIIWTILEAICIFSWKQFASSLGKLWENFPNKWLQLWYG